MKGMKMALLGLAFLGFTDCVQPPKTAAQERKDLVENLQNETISLVSIDERGIENVFCSGVWIDYQYILTAHHCVNDGIAFNYQVYDDKMKVNRKAFLVKGSHVDDLALLLTDPAMTPIHPIAKLTDNIWVGEHINIMGHTMGLEWSYVEGVISSQRANVEAGGDFFPLLLQISSPAWKGNSGGGAFDDEGRLIGICSWVSLRAPMMTFFIHEKRIKEFLSK
jgi:S1-C subfamily serine protease